MNFDSIKVRKFIKSPNWIWGNFEKGGRIPGHFNFDERITGFYLGKPARP